MRLKNLYKEGMQIYPSWLIHKNISWHNICNYPRGILHGLLTFEWIEYPKIFVKRLKLPKIWMPPIYAKRLDGRGKIYKDEMYGDKKKR